MLQDLIKNFQTSLASYSQGLSKQKLLVDIPWTMVDGDLNLQRLIFKKDKSLYIVKEGEIQESKWEYLPEMNSLVINLGNRRILMNEVFADGTALILKKDGMGMEFIAFANQNLLPSLNLVEYINKTLANPPQPEDGIIDTLIDWIIKIVVYIIVMFISFSGIIWLVKRIF